MLRYELPCFQFLVPPATGKNLMEAAERGQEYDVQLGLVAKRLRRQRLNVTFPNFVQFWENRPNKDYTCQVS